MRFLSAFLLAYLALLVGSLLLLLGMTRLLGAESLLVPGEWRLATWFAVVGPLFFAAVAFFAGFVAGRLGGVAPGAVLAIAIVVVGLVLGLTTITRRGDTEERRWTPKFTELIRRVRSPVPSMIAGPVLAGGAIVLGTGIGILRNSRRRPDDLPNFVADRSPGRR